MRRRRRSEEAFLTNVYSALKSLRCAYISSTILKLNIKTRVCTCWALNIHYYQIHISCLLWKCQVHISSFGIYILALRPPRISIYYYLMKCTRARQHHSGFQRTRVNDRAFSLYNNHASCQVLFALIYSLFVCNIHNTRTSAQVGNLLVFVKEPNVFCSSRFPESFYFASLSHLA